ncbi:MAG: hypothetical protein ABI867_33845 [Kofleriaceae bacterium]
MADVQRTRKWLTLGIVVAIAALGVAVTRSRDVERDGEDPRRDGTRTVEERTARAAELDQLVIQAAETDAAFQSDLRTMLTTQPKTTGSCPVSPRDLDLRYLAPGLELDGTRFAEALRLAVVEGHADLLRGHNPNARRSERPRHELVLVLTKRVVPVVTGNAFVPGEMAGRAVVWDAAERRVARAGDVAVENMESLYYTFDRDASVEQRATRLRWEAERDLQQRMKDAIAERLRAVGDELAVKTRPRE